MNIVSRSCLAILITSMPWPPPLVTSSSPLSNLFSEILATKGTLKEVVDGHADAHAFIEGEEWSTLDFDTPRDFEHAKKLFEMHD
jgi:hypothetical protein